MAAIPTTVVTGIDSIEREPDGTVTTTLQSAAQHLALRFPKNALTELFVILTSLPPPESGFPLDLSPIRALGVTPFGHSDGTAGLLFALPGGWGIPFAIPPTAIAGVRSAIDQVELLAKAMQGSTR